LPEGSEPAPPTPAPDHSRLEQLSRGSGKESAPAEKGPSGTPGKAPDRAAPPGKGESTAAPEPEAPPVDLSKANDKLSSLLGGRDKPES
jgi:hypothetical protein